jgi:rhamnosyltransferase subunit B
LFVPREHPRYVTGAAAGKARTADNQPRTTEHMTGKRIVLSTFGSFGDVHPYVALALELQRRGHRPVVATSEMYREKMDAAGLELHAVRPDDLPTPEEPERMSAMLEKMLHPRSGMDEIFKKMILPYVRASYEDIKAAVGGADLLLTHPLPFVGPVVAEKTRVPWASSILAPASLLSRYDPPVFPQLGPLNRLTGLHPLVMGALRRAGRWVMRDIERAVNRLRAEEGLPPSPGHPFMEAQYSPRLNLALFSKVLARPQRDWPANTHVTGFPFYDRRDYSGETETPRGLLKFLDAGPPPVVFTLGSAAFWVAKDFYTEAVKAARSLNVRALLLVGHESVRPAGPLPANVAAFEYAPFGEALPRAAVVVHHGGVGTTGQSLRAGRPQLVVPFSHDQFDNGARAARLGAARVLPRAKFDARSAERELGGLLNDASYAERAAEVGRVVRGERGAETACDLIERVLAAGA